MNTNFKYRSDIDGLRAIAVMSVVAFHAFPSRVPGGFVGVDIFFIISGFLISITILQGLESNNFSFRDFYSRRIKRIFPALIIILASCIILGWYVLLSDEFESLGKYIAAGATFVSNFILWKETNYFDAATQLNPLLHLWSLGIEEQFYIFWPLFLFLAYKLKLNLLLLLCLITMTSFVFNLTQLHVDPAATYYLPVARFWELSAGSILAYLTINKNHHLNNTSRLVAGISLIGLSLIIFAMFSFNKTEPFGGYRALLPTVGTLLLISAGPTAWLNRNVLSHPLLISVGLISYPLYLWHWPLLSFARIIESGTPTRAVRLVILILSIILAWLTYQWIEKPVRRSGKWISVFLIIGLMIIGLTEYPIYEGMLTSRATSNGLEKIVKAVGDWNFPTANLKSFVFDGKTFYQAGTNTKTVLFFGDSNMEQYWPRIEKLLLENPKHTESVIFATRDGCVPIPHVIEKKFPECDGFVDTVTALSESKNIDKVVIAALWFDYFYGQNAYYYEESHSNAGFIFESEGSKKSYQALEKMLTDFKQKGKKTYLVLSIPEGKEFDPKYIIKRSLYYGGFKISKSSGIATENLLKKYGSIRQHLKEVGYRSGAIVIDPLDVLCNLKECPAILAESGEPIYKDAAHLRPEFVREKILFLDAIIKE